MFDWITGTIRSLGYAGVASLMLLENVFPPIPSELVIPLAGFVANQGTLTIPGVIIAGSAGSLAGATFWYWLGRRVGERRLQAWVRTHGKWLTLGPSDVEQSKAWFKRYGAAAVFLGRLVPGVRTFISLPAGFAGMGWGKFLVFSAAGTVIWTAALTYAGVILRSQFTRVGDYVNIATNILLAGFLVLMIRRYINCWRSS
jgi:membrane protein DedA with SNARE-associated domain